MDAVEVKFLEEPQYAKLNGVSIKFKGVLEICRERGLATCPPPSPVSSTSRKMGNEYLSPVSSTSICSM